jgi:hypothetical protein
MGVASLVAEFVRGGGVHPLLPGQNDQDSDDDPSPNQAEISKTNTHPFRPRVLKNKSKGKSQRSKVETQKTTALHFSNRPF